MTVETRAAVEFRQVAKTFASGDSTVQAVSEIDLRVLPGEVVLVMGPSGAGKTTLLAIAGTLMRPNSGTVLLDGIEVTSLSEKELPLLRQQKVGFIFQSFNLLPALTASQNIELVLGLRGLTGAAARRTARELLAMVGLEDRAKHRPNALSGGEQQRVAIARAMANNPTVILADEPTANLDSHRGREIMTLLQMTARDMGKAVLAVTHDLRHGDIADRVLWMEDGRLGPQPGALASQAEPRAT